MRVLTSLALSVSGIFPHVQEEGQSDEVFIPEDVIENLGIHIALLLKLNILFLEIDFPSKLLFDALAYGKHGRFQELVLRSPFLWKIENIGRLADASDAKVFGDALVTTSRIQILNTMCGLHRLYFEKIILPALAQYKATGGVPIHSCTEIYLAVEYWVNDGWESTTEMSGDDLAGFLDHFASLRLQKLTLDFSIFHDFDATHVSEALKKFMKNRPFSGELSVWLSVDNDTNVLSELINICERQPFATIKYSVHYDPETIVPFEAIEQLRQMERKFEFDEVDESWELKIFPKASGNRISKDPFEAHTVYPD